MDILDELNNHPLVRDDLNGWPWDELRPDGDVELSEQIVDTFRLKDVLWLLFLI